MMVQARTVAQIAQSISIFRPILEQTFQILDGIVLIVERDSPAFHDVRNGEEFIDVFFDRNLSGFAENLIHIGVKISFGLVFAKDKKLTVPILILVAPELF